ncbi:hypothetical protein MMC17_004516 [Xylographa soralifera]|nr:hypothetical protein [Xylographa soralifera]
MATNPQLGTPRQNGGRILSRHLNSPAVALAVGEQHRLFFWAHKALLADIPFFRSRFVSANVDNAEPIIGVDMLLPAEFEVILAFLYQHPPEVSELSLRRMLRLIPLHELCEDWGAIRQANDMMTVMIAWIEQNRYGGEEVLCKPMITEIYDRGTKESKLRKFVVWYAVSKGVGIDMNLKWLEKAVQYDSRFAADVAFYSTRLQDKDVSVREIAISGLRGSLYITENGSSAAV